MYYNYNYTTCNNNVYEAGVQWLRDEGAAYNPETGCFEWTRQSGQAGPGRPRILHNPLGDTKHPSGRRRVRVDGALKYNALLVWVWHNGPVPEGMQIDHIDEDKTNDRIENLTPMPQVDNLKKHHANRRAA